MLLRSLESRGVLCTMYVCDSSLYRSRLDVLVSSIGIMISVQRTYAGASSSSSSSCSFRFYSMLHIKFIRVELYCGCACDSICRNTNNNSKPNEPSLSGCELKNSDNNDDDKTRRECTRATIVTLCMTQQTLKTHSSIPFYY